jgi:hypothetical protein
MKDDPMSRAMIVREPRAAAAMTDPKLRRVVLGFVREPRSVSAVATATGADLRRLHQQVVKLCALGLLEVVEARQRAGRPIKLYRAAAEAFFVPHEAAPELATEGLARELRQAVRAEAQRAGEGMLFSVDDGGAPRMQLVTEDGTRPRSAETWLVLRLEPGEAEALHRELREVIERHAAASSRRGKPHLVHAAIVERR